MNDGQSSKPGAMNNTAQMHKRGKVDPSLGRDVQAKIGNQLRAYYDGLIEPTPDRFVDLLRQLDQAGGKGSAE